MNNINLDWFAFWADIVPKQKAITTLKDKLTYSYGDINNRGIAIAKHFYHNYTIRKGDRIAVLTKNCIENIYLFAAAQKLGVILVPLNYRLTIYELSQLIIDSEPSLLIYDEEFEIPKTDCKTLSVKSVNQFQSENNIPAINLSTYDPVFILYTSGSTGVPKGVLYTHRMLYWNSLNTSVSLGINSETSALVCMPPFHTGGWNVLLTPVIHHGGHVILTEKFEASQILEALQAYNCNQFMAVPTMLKMLSKEPIFHKLSLKNLPYIIVGGESMDIDLIKVYENKNISIRQGFGMTEAGPNLTSLHHDKSLEKIGSIGKPNMYVNIKLIDENGEDVKQGELGELCFSGPIVTPSYWRNDEASKAAIMDNWLQSGDIASMDDEGYIYIRDRKKNMFISGGENVYPAEIEKILLTHPAISEVVVISTPDIKWGEVGKAFIVPNEPIAINEIIEFCKERLSKFKIPKHFEFIDEMPLNSTGKINRKGFHS